MAGRAAGGAGWRGEHFAPVLLVRGDLLAGRPLVVADGYHRICASYHVNEDTAIPCRIADPAALPVGDVDAAGGSA